MTPEAKITTLEKAVQKLTAELSYALILITKLVEDRDSDELFPESDRVRIRTAEQELRELADRIR